MSSIPLRKMPCLETCANVSFQSIFIIQNKTIWFSPDLVDSLNSNGFVMRWLIHMFSYLILLDHPNLFFHGNFPFWIRKIFVVKRIGLIQEKKKSKKKKDKETMENLMMNIDSFEILFAPNGFIHILLPNILQPLGYLKKKAIHKSIYKIIFTQVFRKMLFPNITFSTASRTLSPAQANTSVQPLTFSTVYSFSCMY